jgi:NAD(P)-dependent dehydrogenase (short-subunit alcohol dehydrogenase family)
MYGISFSGFQAVELSPREHANNCDVRAGTSEIGKATALAFAVADAKLVITAGVLQLWNRFVRVSGQELSARV